MGVAHVGLVHRDPCECKVKGFHAVSSIERNVSKRRHLQGVRQTDYNWHYRVRTIVLKTREDVASILTAMHDINKAIENSHVKTNFVHTLHCMQKVRPLPVSSLVKRKSFLKPKFQFHFI